MTRRVAIGSVLAACAVAARLGALLGASAPVEYRISIPEPEHHWLNVEMTLRDIEPGPLELVMSRSSPGRYALHDFAKNVYDLAVEDLDGRPLGVARPDPARWVVEAPGIALRVRYKVFGDVVDGTYLGVDETHAHINMPAALMWARGFDDRPATVAFEPPETTWRVATQLLPGGSPFEFTAPNLQYLMDSPVEIGPIETREFSTGGRQFRLAVHHTGRNAIAMDRLARDAMRIVSEERAVFGEFPAFESGRYTFLGDFLPEARSRLHAVLRLPRAQPRRPCQPRRDGIRGVGSRHERHRTRTTGAIGGGVEPVRHLHRRLRSNGSDELVGHRGLLLPPWGSHRARARHEPARSLRRARDARRLHAGDVARPRTLERRPARLRGSSLHNGRRRGSTGRGERRHSVCRRVLRPLRARS